MKSYLAELIGTALLLAIVTGSGIMGETLAAGNAAVALLANSIATGAGLYVLISLLGPISGANFNPVVSMMFWKMGEIKTIHLCGYWIAQFTGAILGVLLTHLMFNLPIIQQSEKIRTGPGIWISELTSTMVLLSVIYLGVKVAKDEVPMLVALTVTSGYWFTSSTFFANPAVAFARSFTNTFVGISPWNVGAFIGAEVLATVIILQFIGLMRVRSSK